MNADVNKLFNTFDLRENRCPTTMKLNMNADISTEGPAPAKRLNNQSPAMMINAATILDTFDLFKGATRRFSSVKIIPRCNPEMAMMWTTPVFEYDCTSCLSNSSV